MTKQRLHGATQGPRTLGERFAAPRSADDPAAPKVLAALFLGGGTLALLWLLAPHDPRASDVGVGTCVALAGIAGGLLLKGRHHLPPSALPVVVAFAIVPVISPAIYFTHSHTSAFSLFYLWAALYAFYFLSLRQAALQTALIAVSYAIVLVLLSQAVEVDQITRWALTVATTIMAGSLVRMLTQGLRSSEDAYRLVFERNPQPMWVFANGTLDFLAVNDAAVRSYGYSREEFLGMTIREIRPSADVAELERTIHDPAALAAHGGIWRHRKKDGTVIDVEVMGDTVTFDDRSARLVTSVDVTSRRAAERELRHRADHDDLTGLLNRRGFEAQAERLVADCGLRGTSCALLLMDLDHFKFVNDSFGHSVGDELIRRVAHALPERLRRDDLLARLGGDEFAILLDGADHVGAVTAAGAVIEHLRSHVRQGMRPTTASVGVAVFDSERCSSARDMLVAADIALYDAKDAGRNRFAVAGGPGLTWVEEVRDAIESERLELHSQPILNLASGELEREELLVRMLDEHGEMIPPASFIPTAERFGMIQQLDRWVVSQGIRLVQAGRTVEVNLSAHSIGDRELTGMVAAAFASREGAERLVFEITETAAAANFDEVRDFAERVSRIGCGFALDDFGTGFGSFSYLKHVPVRYLKIDMDFVRELTSSPADQRIVKAIVNIAEGLGQMTIAEGVEDAETLALLRQYGVHFAQGFHIGRPAALAAQSSELSCV